MKRKRKVAAVAVGMILGLGGCMPQKTDSIHPMIQREGFGQRQNQMEQYLRRKYGNIKYEVTGIIWKFWNQPYDQMNIRIQTEEREENCWVRRYEKNGEIIFTDSYFGLCIRKEYEKKMEKTAKIVFSKVKVFSFTQESEFSQNAEEGLEKLKENGERIRAISWIFVDDRDHFERKVRQFEALWRNEKMESLIVIFLTDEKVFLTVDRDKAEKIVKSCSYLDRKVCDIQWEMTSNLS